MATLPPFHVRPLCSFSLPDGSTGFSVQLEYCDEETGYVRSIFASGPSEQAAIFAAQQKLVEAVRK